MPPIHNNQFMKKKKLGILLLTKIYSPQDMTHPISLITLGKLAAANDENIQFSGIYRLVALHSGVEELVQATSRDDLRVDFTQLCVPSTTRSLVSDNFSKGVYHHEALDRWNAGVCCHRALPTPFVLFDVNSDDFQAQFDAARDEEVFDMEGKLLARISRVYELPVGTDIPPGVGIEQDRTGHICMYPAIANAPITRTGACSTSPYIINAFAPLQPSWRPHAILQIPCHGFILPNDFPPNSSQFPFQELLTAILRDGTPDDALMVWSLTAQLVEGHLNSADFIRRMERLTRSFALYCHQDDIEMTLAVANALQGLRLEW
jgi:hypothetical protein